MRAVTYFEIISIAEVINDLLGKHPTIILDKCSRLADSDFANLRSHMLACREMLYKMARDTPLFTIKEYIWNRIDGIMDFERLLSFHFWEKLDREIPSS